MQLTNLIDDAFVLVTDVHNVRPRTISNCIEKVIDGVCLRKSLGVTIN